MAEEKYTYTGKFRLRDGKIVSVEFQLGDYLGLETELKIPALPEKTVDREVATICRKYATYQVTEEAAKRGDQVNINFLGLLNGEPFDDGLIEDFDLKLGSKTFVTGFEEQIAGHKAGEHFELEVTFPEQYPAEELCGQKATFQITLNEVKRLTSPKPDDEIAKKAGYEDLDDMLEKIRVRKREQQREQLKMPLQNTLVRTVAAQSAADIPEELIESTVLNMKDGLTRRLQAKKQTMEDYLTGSHLTPEELEEKLRADAHAGIMQRLVICAVVEKEHLEPSQKEIDSEYSQYIRFTGMKPKGEQVKSIKMMLAQNIRAKKAAQFVVNHSVITDIPQ